MGDIEGYKEKKKTHTLSYTPIPPSIMNPIIIQWSLFGAHVEIVKCNILRLFEDSSRRYFKVSEMIKIWIQGDQHMPDRARIIISSVQEAHFVRLFPRCVDGNILTPAEGWGDNLYGNYADEELHWSLV